MARTLVTIVALGAACGRTQLDLAQAPEADAGVDFPSGFDAGQGGTDARVEASLDASLDASREAAPDSPRDVPGEPVPAADAREGPPPCQPRPEVCNGMDDDCDGLVDEGQAPIPCPNGGNRYCIAGGFSDCPRRCEVCVPGSSRVCLKSFCTYWGVQDCSADGRSFGPCKEVTVPRECAGVASASKRSRELEQCCLDKNYCCVDDFDLDNDGDHTEMIGHCEAVECTP